MRGLRGKVFGTLYPPHHRYFSPYNLWLSKKFDAHINVEICSSVKSIKYLFKYVYKRYDCATLELRVSSDGEQHNVAGIDEISTYLGAC